MFYNFLFFSKGIEIASGAMAVLIARNTKIPTEKSQIFTTHEDNQASIGIEVFEGEKSMTRDNYLLGSFELFGIPPAPRGAPKIEVTFNIDANGILNVSAVEKSSGKDKKMKITNDQGHLSKDEIERRIMDAQTYKKEDEIELDRVRAKNSLESYCYDIRTSINDENIINDHDKKKIIDAIEETLAWLERNQVRHTLFLCIRSLLTFFSMLKKNNSNTNAKKSKIVCQHNPFRIEIYFCMSLFSVK
jgi:heat shock protein 1/8